MTLPPTDLASAARGLLDALPRCYTYRHGPDPATQLAPTYATHVVCGDDERPMAREGEVPGREWYYLCARCAAELPWPGTPRRLPHAVALDHVAELLGLRPPGPTEEPAGTP